MIDFLAVQGLNNIQLTVLIVLILGLVLIEFIKLVKKRPSNTFIPIMGKIYWFFLGLAFFVVMLLTGSMSSNHKNSQPKQIPNKPLRSKPLNNPVKISSHPKPKILKREPLKIKQSVQSTIASTQTKVSSIPVIKAQPSSSFLPNVTIREQNNHGDQSPIVNGSPNTVININNGTSAYDNQSEN